MARSTSVWILLQVTLVKTMSLVSYSTKVVCLHKVSLSSQIARCADSLGAVMMSMSSPLRTSGSGDLGMGRNLSFGNFGTIGDFDPMGSEHHPSMLQSHTPQDLPRNFSLSELAGLDDLDGKQPGS